MFVGCKAPVTHSVQRLWLSEGKALPLVHCCEAHQPGSALRDKPALAATLAARGLTPSRFYRVERVS